MLCYPYSLEHDHTLKGLSLDQAHPSASPTAPEASFVENHTSASLYHFLRDLLGDFLSRLFLFFWGDVSQKLSMSLPLNCACSYWYPWKVASLLFTVSRNMDHEPPDGFQKQLRPWTWLLAAVGTRTQTRPQEVLWTMNITMVSGGSAGHSDQHGPWIPMWFQVMDICVVKKHQYTSLGINTHTSLISPQAVRDDGTAQ